MEAGHLMSKTLPPKINLHEGRERRREKERGGRREGGGKERAFQRGQKGKDSGSIE